MGKTIEDSQKNCAHEKGQTFAYIDVECASDLFFKIRKNQQ
jgi:hypothetical protein